jgi:UDP:flavonoid glycosyltransferase YjiC (YdhE family)
MSTIAYFISPHGFGHAARACAVMAALQEMRPSLQFEIYTQIPFGFFRDSLPGAFNYHPLLSDIGLVQTSPFHEDLEQTLEALDNFLPFDLALLSRLAEEIKQKNCTQILCDIAPLGIAVAKEAAVPSLLIENFTWDWIYEGYRNQAKQFDKHIAYLRDFVAAVDYRIQTQPLCRSAPGNLLTQPVSRKPQLTKEAIRKKLNLPPDRPMIVVSMGGIPPQQYPFLEQLMRQKKISFVIPSASQNRQRQENLVLLPHHSDFYHPDLIHAADMVVGKLGYSTLAEAYWEGIPFGGITRAQFRESQSLAPFVIQEMRGFTMNEQDFQTGDWISQLPDYLSLAPLQRSGPNGREQIAHFILSLQS